MRERKEIEEDIKPAPYSGGSVAPTSFAEKIIIELLLDIRDLTKYPSP